MNRRDLLIGTAAGAVVLAAPTVLRAQTNSGTPVVGGKRVRRRVSTLADSDPFFAAYADAISRLHDSSVALNLQWLEQARIHAKHCNHGGEFFPWHRPYLSLFENICGELIGDPNFAMPYWDWRDNNGRLPAPFFASGSPLNVTSWNDDGVFNSPNWPNIDTRPHRFATADFGHGDFAGTAGQFTAQAIGQILGTTDFALFSQLVDNPHGTAHVFTGGSPASGLGTVRGHFSSGLSPLDPVFWMHHANVDAIWAQSGIPLSQQEAAFADLSKVYEGIFFDAAGAPARPVLGDLFDMNGQDFTYDFLVPDLLSENDRAIQEQIVAAQPQLLELAEQLGLQKRSDRPLVTLGELADVGNTVVGAVNTVAVETTGVLDSLTNRQLLTRNLALMDGAVAVETGRLYARFRNVRPGPGSDGGILKVFVDCPYLNSLTPTTDQHFAGLLSFFACNSEMCGDGRDFAVDITAPVQQLSASGALDPSLLRIQLLPESGDMPLGTLSAMHGAVELIST